MVEHFRSERLICPHCGHVDVDPWDHDFGIGMDGSATLACGSCDKEFFCERGCDVWYSTAPVKTDDEDPTE